MLLEIKLLLYQIAKLLLKLRLWHFLANVPFHCCRLRAGSTGFYDRNTERRCLFLSANSSIIALWCSGARFLTQLVSNICRQLDLGKIYFRRTNLISANIVYVYAATWHLKSPIGYRWPEELKYQYTLGNLEAYFQRKTFLDGMSSQIKRHGCGGLQHTMAED